MSSGDRSHTDKWRKSTYDGWKLSPQSAEDWEIFQSMKGHREAAQLMTRIVNQQIQTVAEDVMGGKTIPEALQSCYDEIQEKWWKSKLKNGTPLREFGVSDTEPRWHLHDVLNGYARARFGVDFDGF